LLDEFRRLDGEPPSGEQLRFTIGDSLERIADESVFDEVIAIALDTKHGASRGLVVAALGNMRRARAPAVATLMTLLEDPEVRGYAVMGLGKIRAGEAREAIERLIPTAASWERREIKKALRRMSPDKSES
jgi:HEAT repeat protein